MNRIFSYLCIFFTLFCAVNSIELTRAFFAEPNNTRDLSEINFSKLQLEDIPVDQECKDKLQTEIIARVNEIQENLIQNNLTKENIRATNQDHQAKLTELGTKIECCSMWEIMDITVKIVKQCNTAFGKQFNKLMKQDVKKKEQSPCSKYKYHSTECFEIAGQLGGNNSAGSFQSNIAFLLFFFTLSINFY